MTKCAVQGCENEADPAALFRDRLVCIEHPKQGEQYQDGPNGTLVVTPNEPRIKD